MSIVVAYTPDPAGQAALDLGLAEAKLRGQELIVVHATSGDTGRHGRAAHADEIRSVEEALAEAGVQHTVKEPVGPDIADLVLAQMEQAGAELLVVGLRKRSPVGKLFLGSVSQRLLLDSPVPVFAIHGKK
ncbi:MAG: universal stress protein [Tetrasphaera sp.]